MKIAILGAMEPEVKAYGHMHKHGHEVYVGYTGVGKTAAAMNTQRVISEFKPDAIIFSGVGGALELGLEIGELGIVDAAIDCEMDVQSWDKSYQRGEIPFTHERVFRSDKKLIDLAIEASEDTFDAYSATGSQFLDAESKY
ncbi:hypothetical protein HN587_03830 [Candidatus Woesearchaeota archaeon]|jgi:nucleoside phosphorylase|nr:hypothetical protein [Candidatus Woesearchaeota archaeon]